MVSVSCLGVRVSVMYHFMCVHYTFSSVRVAEWPPFGKYSIFMFESVIHGRTDGRTDAGSTPIL